MDAADQEALDRLMIELDGTPNKKSSGPTHPGRVAGGRARGALSSGAPLYRYLAA